MDSLRHFRDSELVDLLKQGSDRAFAEIYDRYWEQVAQYAIRLTKSEEEGLDIVQEIFVSVWRRRETIEMKGSLGAYLIKAARNLSLKYMANNLHKHHFMEGLSRSLKSVWEAGESDRVYLKQLQAHVDQTVARLPQKMRTVYLLSREEQLSHKEIASQLGISEKTVKKQINNALKIIAASIHPRSSMAIVLYCLAVFR